MLTDLNILLHTKSVSYCYYENNSNVDNWIPIDVLKQGILFALKNKLQLKFVYPKYILPKEYEEIINNLEHINIIPSCYKKEDNSMFIFSSLMDFKCYDLDKGIYLLHIKSKQIKEAINEIIAKGGSFNRLDIIIDDVENIDDLFLAKYKKELERLSFHIKEMYDQNKEMYVNLVTDRMFLCRMHNCDAGVHNITLAPNGYFYICPAFYYNNSNDNIGNIEIGINIRNEKLYHLEYAPICRECDAYHCKRCVWLNKKLTLEVNTPSREQCMISHIERNVSKLLLETINSEDLLINNRIEEIDYLDPFDKIK